MEEKTKARIWLILVFLGIIGAFVCLAFLAFMARAETPECMKNCRAVESLTSSLERVIPALDEDNPEMASKAKGLLGDANTRIKEYREMTEYKEHLVTQKKETSKMNTAMIIFVIFLVGIVGSFVGLLRAWGIKFH